MMGGCHNSHKQSIFFCVFYSPGPKLYVALGKKICPKLYGTECWTVKSQHENQVSVGEMRMLR